MTTLPSVLARAEDGNGTLAWSIAAAISASTSGRANWLAADTRMKRACLPDPNSSFFGSGNGFRYIKYRRTPSGRAAIAT